MLVRLDVGNSSTTAAAAILCQSCAAVNVLRPLQMGFMGSRRSKQEAREREPTEAEMSRQLHDESDFKALARTCLYAVLLEAIGIRNRHLARSRVSLCTQTRRRALPSLPHRGCSQSAGSIRKGLGTATPAIWGPTRPCSTIRTRRRSRNGKSHRLATDAK